MKKMFFFQNKIKINLSYYYIVILNKFKLLLNYYYLKKKNKKILDNLPPQITIQM